MPPKQRRLPSMSSSSARGGSSETLGVNWFRPRGERRERGRFGRFIAQAIVELRRKRAGRRQAHAAAHAQRLRRRVADQHLGAVGDGPRFSVRRR
jgi:hypothetical protein